MAGLNDENLKGSLATSQLKASAIITGIFAFLAVFLSIWRLPSPLFVILTLSLGVLAGVVISSVIDRRELKIIEVKGESKISPATWLFII